MRIVWAGSLYLPDVPAGAEWSTHETLLAWQRAGHDVCFWRHGLRAPYEVEGIPVTGQPPRRCDVVIGQLGHAAQVHAYAGKASSGIAWMTHSSAQLGTGGRGVQYIANSVHVQERMPSAWLLRPHVPCWRYEQGRCGSCATLVNVSDAKGADVLQDLARRMPGQRFLGVRGAWDQQRWRPGVYENLTVWATQPQIRTVLAATRVLLMPSAQESWGRIGVEAACRGIPTIAHPCAGIKESLGDAAVYADRRRPDEWQAQLDEVLAEYRVHSARARRRAARLEQQTGVDQVRVLAQLEEKFG